MVRATFVMEQHLGHQTYYQNVRNVVQDLFSFANMDFAKTLYISKIYEAVESIAGVDAANVSSFKVDRPIKDLMFRRSSVPPDGRIIAGDLEIPTLTTLNVSISGRYDQIHALKESV